MIVRPFPFLVAFAFLAVVVGPSAAEPVDLTAASQAYAEAMENVEAAKAGVELSRFGQIMLAALSKMI